MTVKELISAPKIKLKVHLWSLLENKSLELADYLSQSTVKNTLFAFDRYTWSELSSGQMPPELMPSFMADFISISLEFTPQISEDIASTSVELTNFEIDLEHSLIKDSEPDFNGACYLIIDDINKLHFLSSAYDFEGQVEACFFVPTEAVQKELADRVRDKEKIKIDTGIQPRC